MIYTLTLGIDKEEKVQEIFNCPSSYIFKKQDGTYEARKYDAWTNQMTRIETDNQVEAVLRLTTDKSEIAIKRAVNKAKKVLEEQQTMVCYHAEPTKEYNEIMEKKDYFQRVVAAEKVIKLLKILRPRQACVGSAEWFWDTNSMLVSDFMGENQVRSMKTRNFTYLMPPVGTPVLRLWYGFKNQNKYSSNYEYLYIKV